jgi:hypothetical protein
VDQLSGTLHGPCAQEILRCLLAIRHSALGGLVSQKVVHSCQAKQTQADQKFVGMLRNHEDLLLNYFKANQLYTSGIVECLRLRINLCMRKASGYRSFELLKLFLHHPLEDLPNRN